MCANTEIIKPWAIADGTGTSVPHPPKESLLRTWVARAISALGRHLADIRTFSFSKITPKYQQQSSSSCASLPDCVPLANAPAWGAFTGTAALSAWTREIRNALSGSMRSREDWQVLGPAIIIEHEHPSIVGSLVQRLAADIGISLVTLDSDSISTLPNSPTAFEEASPILLYLEPGEWQQQSEDESSAEFQAQIRSRVCDLARSFDPVTPVILVTTTQDLKKVNPELKEIGCFDRHFILPSVAPSIVGEFFLDQLGRERCADALIGMPEKIGKLLSYEYDSPEQRRFAVLHLRRLHARRGKPIEFVDLVELHTQGLSEAECVETEDAALRKRVAIHEAGHATVAVIDSQGEDIPEYSSIIPGNGKQGVVVDSISYAFTCDQTFLSFRHAIRVSLGGRAAEELIYGPLGISNGSSGDLDNCTRKVSTAFAYWGFAPDMDEPGASSKNLLVVVNDPSLSEHAHLEQMARQFLDREYRAVLDLLSLHRSALDTVAERLETCAFLDQADLAAISHEVGILGIH